MKLWTIQTLEAYQVLSSSGVLVGDWRRVWKSFKPAYKWLVHQMEARDIRLGGKPPIWGWLRKPDLRYGAHLPRGTLGVRLLLEVPNHLVLLSDFEGWHSVLGGHFLALNDVESEMAFDEPGFTRQEIMRSWGRVFDLTLFPGGFVQASFPSIEQDYIRSAQRFVAR